MLVEVNVPVMLMDRVPPPQGLEPVIVMLPPERVPLKLWLVPCIESVNVPVKVLPDSEIVIVPTGAVSVVVPSLPRPTPDCATVAVPEKVPLPWLDTVCPAQFPAMFEFGLLELLQAASNNNRVPSARVSWKLMLPRMKCFSYFCIGNVEIVC
jgi:hypothetical protein